MSLYAVSLPLLVTNVKLTLSTGLWWYILAAAALVAATYVVYRYTLPPVSRLRRTFLWALRGLALILIALLVFEPVVSYLFRQNRLPTIALLLDGSASIAVSDSSRSGESQLRRWLASNAISSLADRGTLVPFEFSDSLQAVSAESLQYVGFSGTGTDISGAIERAKQTLADKHLAAIVLVSDGIYTAGENPVRTASETSVPIYAIGVGDTASSRDLTISRILTNEITYVGSTVPIDIRIHGRGFKGQETTVRLMGPKSLEYARETVKFSDDDSEVSASLSFTAEQSGDLRVTAALDPLDGEALTDNNRRSVIIKVLDNRSRVLIFSGPPMPDLTALRQTLEADSSLEVKEFVESSGGGLLFGSVSPSDDDLGNAALIVLVNYPTGAASDALLQRLHQAVTERDVSLLFFAGPQVSASKLARLSEVLPFEAKKQVLSGERVLIRETASHTALSSGSVRDRDWGELPPVTGGLENFEVKPSAQVVAKLSRESLGLMEDEPAVVLWQLSRQHGAAFFCWGLYRWKVQPASEGSTFYDQLIPRMVAWLIAPAEAKRVRIQTNKRLYSGGEKVQFVGEAYGADLVPRDGAVINLRVTSGDRSESVAMRSRGNGRYEGELIPWSDGDYSFSGVATQGDDTLGSDRGAFAVEAFNIELLDTRARFDVLHGMADASNGGFATLAHADSLLSRLSFKPETVTIRREITLWNRAMVIWLIIALLATEWILRKRSGML